MQIIRPLKLDPHELDYYLARGWFRMHQSIFTTSIEWFRDGFYEVIWLRVSLKDFKADKKYNELHKKNRSFRTEFKPAEITLEHEQLFSNYKMSKSFEASASLNTLLYDDNAYNVYNTWMINTYDGNELIGTGFFDIGKKSAAGISSFYHPDYYKCGLGMYMIYQKMFYCQQNNFDYFYPGYYSPDYPAFDYKLKIGKTALEYYSVENQNWIKY